MPPGRFRRSLRWFSLKFGNYTYCNVSNNCPTFWHSLFAVEVMEIDRKLPLERRRRDSSSYRLPGIPSQHELSYMRREGDFVRMRSQRWIDLADAALGHRKPSSKSRRHNS